MNEFSDLLLLFSYCCVFVWAAVTNMKTDKRVEQ